MIPTDPISLARRAFHRHEANHPFTQYTGILSLQGLAHCAVEQKDDQLLALARDRLLPFVRGERTFECNFSNYLCGGNATAYLFWQEELPEAEDVVRRYAIELMNHAPRDTDGIFSNPRAPEKQQIWIDVAFAVTPFLLFAGLALGEEAWIEEAFQQTRKMIKVFRDPENGLLHQCRGFSDPVRITEDHWSRGNGWAMLALAELVDALPGNHRHYAEAVRLYGDHLRACLRVQDSDGLWHHEMTLPTSFTETSGSGLILHGLGVGLARGLAAPELKSAFDLGLRGYLRHIDDDANVRNTCEACRSPGDGSIAAYMTMKPVTNDPHAFGPLILTCAAAARLENLAGKASQ